MRWLISIGLAIAFLLAQSISEPGPVLSIVARTSSGPHPTLKKIRIFQAEKAIFYRLPIMEIDLDGAPNAYHPPVPGHPHGNGKGLGLEDLRNASKNMEDGPNAKWIGIVTDDAGTPVIQKDGPFAGFYVSMTSLEDTRFERTDPRRYVDATKIPYVVLNPILKQAGIALGDLAVVVLNPKDPKVAYGIVADIGPRLGLGECSKALANSLGIAGGIEGADIIYIFFPTPKEQRRTRTTQEIFDQANNLFEAWGGITRTRSLP